MLSMEHSDDQLKLFADYIDDLKAWIEAGNPNLFTPSLSQPQIPTNEADLISSMTGGMGNPTQSLPNPTPLDQMSGPTVG
jgi:hypothetical protein